jgi:hypothetical protein
MRVLIFPPSSPDPHCSIFAMLSLSWVLLFVTVVGLLELLPSPDFPVVRTPYGGSGDP